VPSFDAAAIVSESEEGLSLQAAARFFAFPDISARPGDSSGRAETMERQIR
jgi:hypothetical protein